MDEEPKVKGTGFLGIEASVRAVLGDATHARVLELLPAEPREALAYKRVAASSWVPLAWHVALHDAILAATRSGPGVCRRVSHHTTREQLRGVYAVFARVAGPEAVFPRAAALLRTYYTHAELAVRELRRGYTRTEFYACKGFTPALWENFCGACEAVLEASGAANVRVRCAEGGRVGDERLVVEARWT